MNRPNLILFSIMLVLISFSLVKAATPTLFASNTFVDYGQVTVFNSNIVDSNTPYTFNFYVVNSVTSAVVASFSATGVAANSETWTWTPPLSLLGQTLNFNVVIVDNLANTFTQGYDALGYNGPTVIEEYPVNIINYQPTSIQPNYDLPIQLNSSSFKPFEAKNMQNVFFTYQNKTVIPSWLQGNPLNFTNANILNNASRLFYWLKINKNLLPSNVANAIYINFAPTSLNLYGSNTVGESSVLSATYGQYDNGNSIFPTYCTFGGLSSNSLPSGTGCSFSSNAVAIINKPTSTTFVGTGANWGAVNIVTPTEISVPGNNLYFLANGIFTAGITNSISNPLANSYEVATPCSTLAVTNNICLYKGGTKFGVNAIATVYAFNDTYYTASFANTLLSPGMNAIFGNPYVNYPLDDGSYQIYYLTNHSNALGSSPNYGRVDIDNITALTGVHGSSKTGNTLAFNFFGSGGGTLYSGYVGLMSNIHAASGSYTGLDFEGCVAPYTPCTLTFNLSRSVALGCTQSHQIGYQCSFLPEADYIGGEWINFSKVNWNNVDEFDIQMQTMRSAAAITSNIVAIEANSILLTGVNGNQNLRTQVQLWTCAPLAAVYTNITNALSEPYITGIMLTYIHSGDGGTEVDTGSPCTWTVMNSISLAQEINAIDTNTITFTTNQLSQQLYGIEDIMTTNTVLTYHYPGQYGYVQDVVNSVGSGYARGATGIYTLGSNAETLSYMFTTIGAPNGIVPVVQFTNVNTLLNASIILNASTVKMSTNTFSFNVIPQYGTTPYSYAWTPHLVSATPNGCALPATSATQSFSITTNSQMAGCSYNYTVVVTDSASTNQLATFSTAQMQVQGVSLGLSNTLIDQGQSILFTANVFDPLTGPYSFNYLIANAVPDKVVANAFYTGITGSANPTNTFFWTPNPNFYTSNTFEVNVIVKDNGATANTMNTIEVPFGYNAAMGSLSLTSPSPTTQATGNTLTWSISFSGGTSTYTYNWLVYNTITNAIITNQLWTGNTYAGNTFSWTLNSAMAGNTVNANVFITDSATTPVTVNSVLSSTITLVSGSSPSSPTLPTGIVCYVPITLTNNQASAVSANTPLSFLFNAIAYQTCETNTLNNTELFWFNGTIAPSWLEGNVQNEQQQANTLYTSNSVLWWFKTPAYSWIGANTGTALTNTIYIGFASNVPSPSSLLWSLSANVGVAPQLTCAQPAAPASCSAGNGVTGSYGQYDDGNSVFNANGLGLYDNFKGSVLSSLWSIASASTVSNGLTIASGDSGVLSQGTFNALSTQATVLQTFAGTSNCNGYANTRTYCSSATALEDWEQSYILIAACDGTCSFGTIKSSVQNGEELTAYGDYQAAYGTVNYTNLASTSSHYTSTNFVSVHYQMSGDSASTNQESVQWVRIATAPPNAIMPSATFGATNIITTYTSPSSPILTLSNTLIDQGQSILFTASVTGGNSLYSYNYLIVNSITNVPIANMLYNGITLPTNSFFWTPPNALYTSNTFKANVIIKEQGAYGNTVNTVYTPFGYNALLTVAVSGSTTIENGQSATLTANPSGGTQPYSYLWTGGLTCSGGQTSSTCLASPSSTLTETVTVTDSASLVQTTNSATGTITVVAAMTVPSLTLSNTIIDQGQSILFTATTTQGSQPYSYNYLIVNSITNTIITNMLYTSCTITTNSFFWIPNPNLYTSNTFKANVVITDLYNVKVNSTYNAFGYNSAPTLSITLSNTLIDSGQWQVFTITESGGTGANFNTELYNITHSAQQGSNVLILSVGGQNTISMLTHASGTFSYNAIAYDEGTSVPFVFNSVSKSMNVNGVLAVSLSPTANGFLIGNTQVMTATITGGTSTFTYNWLVTNSAGYSVNALYVGNAYTQNQLSFTPLSVGVYNVQIVVTDTTLETATTSNAVISVLSSNTLFANVIIAPALAAIPIGSQIVYSTNWTGGVPPYKVKLLQYTTDSCAGLGIQYAIVNTNGNSVTFPSISPTTTSYFCSNVTDLIGHTSNSLPAYLVITAATQTTTPVIPLPNATVLCMNATNSYNSMNIICSGEDPNNVVAAWNLTFYNVSSIYGWVPVNTVTITGNSFNYSFENKSKIYAERVIVTALGTGISVPYVFDFNLGIQLSSLSTEAKGFLQLLFLLVGLGLSIGGGAVGVVSEQHVVSTTLIIEAFMLVLTYLLGISVLSAIPIAILAIFLIVISIMQMRHEGGVP